MDAREFGITGGEWRREDVHIGRQFGPDAVVMNEVRPVILVPQLIFYLHRNRSVARERERINIRSKSKPNWKSSP